MQRNMLIGIFLSLAIFTHAQDSLSTQKPENAISGKQTSENNIKYVHFQKSMYGTKNSSENPEFTQKSELVISEYTASELASNWFINAAGGVSSFLGTPLGCEDLFGRLRPVLHLSVGKWFSPTVGGRIAFQGFNLKNHLIEQQDYYHFHADFLWNITNLFRKGEQKDARWQFIPFAGTGIIQNSTTHQHPFTLNYGFLNNLRLNSRLSLSLELGGLTTFGNFDGAGKGNRFSDHLFHLSAGISITLGNKGWNFRQNRVNDLLTQNSNLAEMNRLLKKENGQNYQIMAQMRKILEIEGLLSRLQGELEKYGLSLSDNSISENSLIYYPQNDYSGLNSLRKRLSTTDQNPNQNDLNDISAINNTSFEKGDSQWPAISNDILVSVQDSLSNALLSSNIPEGNQNYIINMMNQKVCIGSPILFFFHIGTSTLVDSSQLANIDEIVRICKKHDLLLKITGYADSATGDAENNFLLSNQRAHYVASELKKRGISEKAIKLAGKGGVDNYSPDKVNRCVKIELYLKR